MAADLLVAGDCVCITVTAKVYCNRYLMCSLNVDDCACCQLLHVI